MLIADLYLLIKMHVPKNRRLIVHATNVHHGGGAVLLSALIGALPHDLPVVAQLDERMPTAAHWKDNISVRYVAPTVVARLQAERWLATNVATDDVVLCFGNLPPLFKLRGYVSLFVQNRHLIENSNLQNFSLSAKLRLQVERRWLSSRIHLCDEVAVQSATMARLFEKRFGPRTPIRIRPFVEALATAHRSVDHPRSCDFIYVAGGEPHKNHAVLIQAWCLLADEGLYPSLKLTLAQHRHGEMLAFIDNLVGSRGLKIDNHGQVSHQVALDLYQSARALIYPSVLESFGIPLLEAKQTGIAILAPELDYVRDLLDPDQTFDATSPVSIARAVKRFLRVPEQRFAPQTPADFIQEVLTHVP